MYACYSISTSWDFIQRMEQLIQTGTFSQNIIVCRPVAGHLDRAKLASIRLRKIMFKLYHLPRCSETMHLNADVQDAVLDVSQHGVVEVEGEVKSRGWAELSGNGKSHQGPAQGDAPMGQCRGSVPVPRPKDLQSLRDGSALKKMRAFLAFPD